eukprot:3397123-Amphidinium_carterae.2
MAEFQMPGYGGHRPYSWSRADPSYKGSGMQCSLKRNAHDIISASQTTSPPRFRMVRHAHPHHQHHQHQQASLIVQHELERQSLKRYLFTQYSSRLVLGDHLYSAHRQQQDRKQSSICMPRPP